MINMEKTPQDRRDAASAETEGAEGVDHGRRSALRKLLGLGVAAVTLGHPAKELLEETVLSESTEGELSSYLEKLKTEFGVEVDFSGDLKDPEMSVRTLSLAEKRDLLETLYSAFRLYPREYVENVGLKTVRGVKWLALRGSGLQQYVRSSRGYVQRSDNTTVNINKEPTTGFLVDAFGWTNRHTVERVFHHEFYHASDVHRADIAFNKDWGDEARRLQGEEGGRDLFSGRKEGHATAYGGTSPKEDRAEIASMLMTEYRELLELAKHEPALANKIQKIKKEFAARSAGLMDDTYWDLLHNGSAQLAQEYFRIRRDVHAKARE